MNKTPGSITRALDAVRSGDDAGYEIIYLRFLDRLRRAAETHFKGVSPGSRDTDIAADSALKSALKAIGGDRLPGIRDRNGLLKFLIKKVRQKSIQQFRKAKSEKRGALKVDNQGDEGDEADLAFRSWVDTRQPSPEEVALWNDFMTRLKARLSPNQMRAIELDLEGYTQLEVAKELGVSPRAVYEYRRVAFDVARDIYS